VLPNLYKLVHGTHTTQDSPIAQFYVTGNLGIIAHDTVTANQAIVCQVTVSHDQAIVAHFGLATVFGTTVNSHKFADGGIVTYFDKRFFSFKLKILRDGGDNGTGENAAVFANSCTFHDGYIATDPGTLTNFYILMNNSEWVNLNIGC
jgi:hypothetical protein